MSSPARPAPRRLAAAAACAALALACALWPAPASALQPYLDTVVAPPPPAEALERLAAYCAARLANSSSARPTPPADSPVGDPARFVLLAVSDGEGPALVSTGGGRGLAAAADVALAALRLPADFTPTWLRVDVAYDFEPLSARTLDQPLDLELGRHGLAVAAAEVPDPSRPRPAGARAPASADGITAWIPEELVARDLLDAEGAPRRPRLERYIASSRPGHHLPTAPLELWRFRTVYGFAGPEGPATRAIGPPPTPDGTTLRAAAQAAGRYLVDALRPDGSYDYVYPDSETNTEPNAADDSGRTADPPRSYNILRHAGTTYALLELFEATGDATFRIAAERALAYLVAQVEPCKLAVADHRCVVERGNVKLGGQGLAVMALAKHAERTGDRSHLDVMRALTDWIRAVQTDRGRFAIHLQTWPGGRVRAFASHYYSGQAILALEHLYRLTGDEALLDAAEAAARYEIAETDTGALTGDTVNHWELIALDALDRQRPRDPWAERARGLAALIAADQHVAGEPMHEIGAFGDPPRPSPTRLEGLAAAHRLLDRTSRDPAGDARRDLSRALALGVARQLELQYRPADALFLDRPRQALGGFRLLPSQRQVRIDHVQHNLSAILALLRLKEPRFPSSEGRPTRSRP